MVSSEPERYSQCHSSQTTLNCADIKCLPDTRLAMTRLIFCPAGGRNGRLRYDNRWTYAYLELRLLVRRDSTTLRSRFIGLPPRCGISFVMNLDND